jgi:hypothetical protein
MRRRSLPQVVIPVPCHVDWNAMMRIDSDGRARFCKACERPVYDSASMTRGDLIDLIARHEGRRLPCVQLHRRPDGTIVTRDCFESFLRVGRALWLKTSLLAIAFWAWALGLSELARERLAAFWAPRAAVETVLGNLEIFTRGPRDPGSLAPLPPSAPPPREIPRLGIRALLPEVAPAAPLLHLEADEDIWKRLEPDRFPPHDPSFP